MSKKVRKFLEKYPATISFVAFLLFILAMNVEILLGP